MLNRRKLLKIAATLATGGVTSLSFGKTVFSPKEDFSVLSKPKNSSTMIFQDEFYWREVSKHYRKVENIINLEHGYWGKMSTPVENHFIDLTRKVNKDMSLYARKHWYEDLKFVKKNLASALGAEANEIGLTRNATESFVSLITQYKGLKSSDAVLWADIDYPSFQRMMGWLAHEKNVEGVKINLPAYGTKQDFIDAYTSAMNKHPNIKLMLLTHVSNQHGLTLPVKEITEIARAKNIDVICDCAQSWGLLDFKVNDLGVDWAVFNLHKWIGSPVGVGALYMRTGTLDKVEPFPGEPRGNNSVQNRVHIATSDFASFLSIPGALDFHNNVGGRNKAERLQYLRKRWVNVALELTHIEVLGAADDEGASGMGGFRIKNQVSEHEVYSLQQKLEKQFGIFTVVRKDLSSGCNIRVTPQIFNTLDDIDALNLALTTINNSI